MGKKALHVRVKLTDGFGNVSFLVVKDGAVRYFSGAEVPLALSNIAGSKAAELRFALADAKSAVAVSDALRRFHVYKDKFEFV